MRHYRKVDPDRCLLPRAGICYYWRRIPAVVAAMDSRSPLVRMSLKTDDLVDARAKRETSVWTPPQVVCSSPPLWHIDAAGGVHPITPNESYHPPAGEMIRSGGMGRLRTDRFERRR
jgi:hypothetical protein